jgi:5-methylcytosine-specific restriction endonuclease McrA
MCYACNDSKSDSESEIATPPKPYIKDPIPRAGKNCLWINFFGTSRVGVCACCEREPITINNFHAGHIKSEKEGGSTTLDNLAPICPLCNSSMGTMHMEEFITKYNLKYGLKK